MQLSVHLSLLSLAVGCATATPSTAHARPSTGAVQQAARNETLTAEAIVDLRSVTAVAVSPDGRHIAFVRREARKADDPPGSAYRILHLVDAKGGAVRPFTFAPDSASAPAWSPDGKWLAYIGRRHGDAIAQLWRISPLGGNAEKLTTVQTSIRDFEWSPDGQQLAYITDTPPSAEAKADRDAGRDWKMGDVEGTPRSLFVLDVRSGKTTTVTPAAFHVERARWSPRGDAFALIGGTRADVDGTMMYGGVYRVPVGGGTPTKLCEHAGKLGELTWSPDGSQVAFLGAVDIHDPTAGVVFTVPAAGGAARARTAGYLGTGLWLRYLARDALIMLANQDTKTALVRISLKDDRRSTVVTGDTICHDVDLNVSGTVIACAGDSRQHPGEVFVGNPRAGSLRRLTHSNPNLLRVRLGEQSVLRWKAADGLELAGIVTKPVGYRAGARYPMVVLPHGGPEGISLDGWNTRAEYPAQLLATRGFVVFEPNYRGSSGRGVAFGKADQKDLGGKEFEDVLAGIDVLVQSGLVDPIRVGMGGWSYGGYFSALAATQHSKRFRAAIVAAAITNWLSFTGTSEIEHENSLVHWNLWPYDEPERVWTRSPMAHARGSTTATLIAHGTEDTRVPAGQAKELYRALKHAGTPTEIVLYPREGHGVSERAHQIDFANRFVEWFERHLAERGQ